MGKPASNGGSVFHFGNFWYNAFHGFLSILLFLAKKRPIENESNGRNRERQEMGRPTCMTFHFPFFSLFSPILIFAFSFILFFFLLISSYYVFTFALLFIVCLTFFNCLINLQVSSLITIHWFGSHFSIERLFGFQKLEGNQFGSIYLLCASLECGSEFRCWPHL